MESQKRDYRELTDSEFNEWEILKQKEIVHKFETITIKHSLFSNYPKAVRHYLQLFPNNYLDIVELKDKERLKEKINHFNNVLSTDSTNEREILNFLNSNCAFFIVGSILKKYFSFGHHEAHIFPEFQLGASYRVDYLLVGKNSDGWSFVFVELESPKNSTISDGELGQAFRKGLSQISDWDFWLDQNFHSLHDVFNKYKKNSESLPEEFYHLDKSRIHYVVIAGRRSDFTEKTYRIKRNHSKKDNIILLHYDNLLDSAELMLNSGTY